MKQLLFICFNFTFLFANAQEAYLGIESNILNKEKSTILEFNNAGGSYISRIIPNTPAEEANLQPFDYLTKVGEFNLSPIFDLTDALNEYNAGDKIELKVIRNGNDLTIPIKLADRREIKPYHRPSEEDPFLGISQSHNKPEGIIGQAVHVSKNTTADYIGMETGDIILKIDEFKIVDWHDVSAAIDARMPGDNIKVTVLRDNETLSFEGRIKSESHNAAINKKIDMENMEVIIEMPEEKETEMVELSLDMEEPINQELEVSDLAVFPNPSVGLFNVEFSSNIAQPLKLIILDSSGRQIISETLNNDGGMNRFKYDLGNSPAGVYYLNLISNKDVMTRKLIVTRS